MSSSGSVGTGPAAGYGTSIMSTVRRIVRARRPTAAAKDDDSGDGVPAVAAAALVAPAAAAAPKTAPRKRRRLDGDGDTNDDVVVGAAAAERPGDGYKTPPLVTSASAGGGSASPPSPKRIRTDSGPVAAPSNTTTESDRSSTVAYPDVGEYDDEEEEEDDPQIQSDLLRLVPPEVVAVCLSYLPTASDRHSLQNTCRLFRDVSSSPAMVRLVDLGGHHETGRGGFLTEDDTPETACDRLVFFSRMGNLQAIYMLGMIKAYCFEGAQYGIALLRLAANRGCVRSAYALGLILRDSCRDESLHWLNAAAQGGFLPAWQELLPAPEMKAKHGDLDAATLRSYLDPACLNRLLGRHYLDSRDVRSVQTSHCWNPLCGRWAYKATTNINSWLRSREAQRPFVPALIQLLHDVGGPDQGAAMARGENYIRARAAEDGGDGDGSASSASSSSSSSAAAASAPAAAVGSAAAAARTRSGRQSPPSPASDRTARSHGHGHGNRRPAAAAAAAAAGSSSSAAAAAGNNGNPHHPSNLYGGRVLRNGNANANGNGNRTGHHQHQQPQQQPHQHQQRILGQVPDVDTRDTWFLRVSRMKMCSSCRRAKYCSKLCQVYDWRSGRHKMECQFL